MDCYQHEQSIVGTNMCDIWTVTSVYHLLLAPVCVTYLWAVTSTDDVLLAPIWVTNGLLPACMVYCWHHMGDKLTVTRMLARIWVTNGLLPT